MRAVVCVPGGTEVADVPDPRPAAGEAVVEVDACGLCGSDVHAVARGFARPGQVLGHELSGRIVETGPGVTGWRDGQPVAVNPLGSCRDCRDCRAGLPFRCQEVPNLGITAQGAYAEYVVVPQGQLVALPDLLPVELGAHAVPPRPLTRASDICHRGVVHPGTTEWSQPRATLVACSLITALISPPPQGSASPGSASPMAGSEPSARST